MAIFTSCDDDDDAGSGTLSIRVSDEPFPTSMVSEANVVIDLVEARQKEEGDSKPFITLSSEEHLFNLLELSNGVTATLVDVEVPAGEYDLIRLFVKSASIVLEDDTEFDLNVPSGSQTGIKVFLDPSIVVSGGLTAELLLDFDVSQSFVPTGGAASPNGFNFKPVIRAVNMSTAGRINGTVTDQDGNPIEGATVTVSQAGEDITSTFSDPDGFYAVIGLPEGTYAVTAEKDDFIAEVADDVEVLAANQTELDISMQQL